MKMIKKIFNVILIFAIIQLVSIIFVNNKTYAGGDSFFEKTFSSGKQWKDMAGSDSDAIIENASNVFSARDDIYNGIRAIGIGIFMVNIAFTVISLSMKNNGKDVAGAKLTITFTFLLALLFIFAEPIMEFIQGIFEQLEGLM